MAEDDEGRDDRGEDAEDDDEAPKGAASIEGFFGWRGDEWLVVVVGEAHRDQLGFTLCSKVEGSDGGRGDIDKCVGRVATRQSRWSRSR